MDASELKMHPQPQGCVYQPLPSTVGSGNSKIFRLDSNLNVIETVYHPFRNLAIRSQIDLAEPCMVVTVGLNGKSCFVDQPGEQILFKKGYTTITTFNSSIGERLYEADRSVTQLRISISKSWFTPYLGESSTDRLFKKDLVHLVSHRSTTHLGLLSAQQITSSRIASEYRPMFIMGQAMTILAAELGSLLDKTRTKSGKINEKDRAMAHAARNILCQEFRSPPSVHRLATRVGTNQLKLKQIFHQIFDSTPYRLLFEFRMNHAYRLLESTHCQVSIAADLVGYNHVSNFSTAFTKHFGVSPKHVSK